MSEKSMAPDMLLETRKLSKEFPITKGAWGRKVGAVKAVSAVDLQIRQGQTVGLVGESGCGKSTLGRTILRAYEPTSGEILFREKDGSVVDLAGLSEKQLKPYRQSIRMVFQDPFSSLNPRMTLADIIGEPLRVNDVVPEAAVEGKVVELLTKVGLRPEYLHRYPNAFSGGERQRVGLARALALDPRLVVADEAVSALDVSVRAQILNLMKDLQEEENLTYLFISHDLGMVEYMADEVVVMYVGHIVESGPTEELYDRPLHPYTEALLSAVPNPDPSAADRRERIVLKGEVADPTDVPSGCPFRTRCAYAQDVCATDVPELRELSTGRRVACHFAEELELRGLSELGAA
jgi:oligopeptide/dipeptide ABC transporter ATP-binding protein